MKKSLLTLLLALSVILTACSEEDINGIATSEADTQDAQAEEKSSNPRSNVTDEEKAEMKRKHEEQKAKEEQAAKQKAEEEAEAQAKAEEAEKPRKENEAKEKAEKESADKADAEAIYLQIMRESVGTYVDIQFDKSNKIYTMTPTDQGLIDEISMLPMGIGHEDWGVLVDGMASMSKSGKDLVGEGYTINLVNPLNHENVILWIMDGEVIYNVIDDL